MLEEKWASIKLIGGDMEKLNINFFYQLGSQLNPLAEMPTEQIKRLDILIRANRAKSFIQDLFTTFPSLNVCKGDADLLLSQIGECVKWFMNTKDDEFTKQDSSVDNKFRDIILKAKKFEAVLLAELGILDVFHPTQKGGYSTADLIGCAEKTIEPIRGKVGQKVIDEIRYSGRCLVFDIPTASGFHILRALEAVLHQYYLVICKPSKDDPLDNWAAYITALYKTEIPEVKKVVALLQQIKDIDRNQIMHPEIVLTSDEAFILFDTAKCAIMLMGSRLSGEQKHGKRRKKTSKA